MLRLTHNAVNNTAPEANLCDLISVDNNITTVRTRASFDPILLRIRSVSKMCANSFFERSFMYAALSL